MTQSGSEAPLLVASTGPLYGQRWTMDKALLIGREPSCDIVIPDRQISRYHARISPTPNGAILEDLGSKNGTYYLGKRVEDPVSLQDGDAFQVALVQHFTFLISDATLPLGNAFISTQATKYRLRLDERSRRLWLNGKEVLPPLSAQQFRLLQALERQQGEVVSREELIQAVWGDEAFGVTEQAFDALVRRLRERLAEIDPHHNYILTIRGHGLRLDNPPVES
ncbi:FHA domain-containing protein [Anaerolinea sp.]|uniref:FHA domain-containing protein n=1 Tax=Anaerolinea sp. TaxID=1872519 RepID=UPI002ACD6FF6|nr:FHA domain-containing protein [Anaerolinea sp.]